MTSLTDLREVVDVVSGVDTHVHTHSAAVLDTADWRSPRGDHPSSRQPRAMPSSWSSPTTTRRRSRKCLLPGVGSRFEWALPQPSKKPSATPAGRAEPATYMWFLPGKRTTRPSGTPAAVRRNKSSE